MKEFYGPSAILDALEDGGDYTFNYKNENPIRVNCKICGSSMILNTKNVTCSICDECATKLKKVIDLLPDIESALVEYPIK